MIHPVLLIREEGCPVTSCPSRPHEAIPSSLGLIGLVLADGYQGVAGMKRKVGLFLLLSYNAVDSNS